MELELGVLDDVRRDECGRADGDEILREGFVVEQFRARHAHHLDGDAAEADVVDVRGAVRTRPGKAHPRLVGARLGEDAPPHVLRDALVDDDLPSHDAVRFGVSRAENLARLVDLPQVGAHVGDDRVEGRLFAGHARFLGERQTLVGAAPVDQGLHRSGDGLAEEAVEGRPVVRVRPAHDVQQVLRAALHPSLELQRTGGHRTAVLRACSPGQQSSATAAPAAKPAASRSATSSL